MESVHRDGISTGFPPRSLSFSFDFVFERGRERERERKRERERELYRWMIMLFYVRLGYFMLFMLAFLFMLFFSSWKRFEFE